MLLAALATLVGSVLQSATGFGVALVASPALFAAFEPNEAVTIMFVISATLNLLMLFSERRPRRVLSDRLVPLLGWALPGLAAGALILAALSKPALQIAVGVAVLIAVVLQARAQAARREDAGSSEPVWAAPAVGLTSGVLSTTTGTSGPPLVLWFHHLRLTPAEVRDTLAAAFLGLNAFGALALEIFGDGLAVPGWARLGALVALAVVGQVIGRSLFERLDARRFRAIGLGLVAAAGVASVIGGLVA
jgi:uncharacterized membrane protein YfcA